MNIEHYIITQILKWPTLYKRRTYEMSRLAVLDHIFCVIGNGMEWKKSRQGAFVTDMNNSGKPYVPPLQTEFPPNYFENFDDLIGKNETKYLYDLKNVDFDTFDLESAKKYHIKTIMKSVDRAVSPYVICEFSALHEMLVGKTNSFQIKNFELKKIKPDWIVGAVDIAKYSLDLYKDSSRDHLHFYSPQKSLFVWEEGWKKAVEKNELDKFRKDRSMPKDISTPLEAATFSWNQIKQEQILILEKFLEKFGNKTLVEGN